MRMELNEITVRELANGYIDNQEAGVVGYDSLLWSRGESRYSEK